MKLVKPINSLKKSKRVGRGNGSGLGRTSGRGHKGAGQRSGFKHRYWFEGGQMPLYRRVPMRGFNNSNFQKSYEIVNLSSISKVKAKNIDSEVLFKNGLISSVFAAVKILGNGELTNTINLKVHSASKLAKEKIEKAGGTVEIIEV